MILHLNKMYIICFRIIAQFLEFATRQHAIHWLYCVSLTCVDLMFVIRHCIYSCDGQNGRRGSAVR